MLSRLDGSILGALLCFETAGRLLSFTKTAQAFNLTQSAVSQQIRHLEDRLGYALFVRQARGLKLTEKGEVLLGTISSAFADINQTLQTLGMSNAPLQVSCLPSLALQWLMPRLTEFHRQQPGVCVRLKAEFQMLDRQAMNIDDIDVALRYDPVQYNRLHADVVLDEYLFPVATPAYLAQHPGFAAGASLDGVTLLHDAAPWAGAPEFVEWRSWLAQARPEWTGHLDGPQFNFSSLAMTAALNHQGVAMGRSALVHDEIVSGRLVDVFGQHVRAPARYVLLSRNPDDPRTALFSDWLKTECARFDEARMQRLLNGRL
ncbi:LysR family transcriptional regulator [Paraburkholderia eburnea]|uniref:LysR family transcriptional regulator n=1 Tax=Paraburkholderia eburnea TaxID=1189126 RepID=A0A2S4LZX8_9BURK|nr:LysR substrate-binding domain-containing protein [Paraburkholderia eburnea]POR47947.1 LysR family transcriptional regulator [Paraburkholderia eburnea]PRZ19341.1 LysR family transcriptional regulator [Paraburkholderia eburnea]